MLSPVVGIYYLQLAEYLSSNELTKPISSTSNISLAMSVYSLIITLRGVSGKYFISQILLIQQQIEAFSELYSIL